MIIQFKQLQNGKTGMYECLNCDFQTKIYFEAYNHFSQIHQNINKEKEELIEIKGTVAEIKDQIKTSLNNNALDIKKKIQTTLKKLSNIDNDTLNYNLRKNKKILTDSLNKYVTDVDNFIKQNNVETND